MSSQSTSSQRQDLALGEKVAFLQRPEVYPERPAAVVSVETHMSWVFLGERYVYKLKKPVHYDFVDFSTLDARHRDCLEEVRLNRRLAADVYLGVAALSVDRHGQLQWGSDGPIVEWLVHMRRLPDDCLLDHAIAHGRVDPARLHEAAQVLSTFYKHAAVIPTRPEHYLAQLCQDVDANFHALAAYDDCLPRTRTASVHAAQHEFLSWADALLAQRVTHIVEGHGDLRPEHVCLRHPPAIIDCLEFSRRFRVLDCVEELAFLGMECEQLGAADIGRRVLQMYADATGDQPPPGLVDFYMSHRATLRAKLSIWHLRDSVVTDAAKWVRRALRYLDLAEQHIDACLAQR